MQGGLRGRPRQCKGAGPWGGWWRDHSVWEPWATPHAWPDLPSADINECLQQPRPCAYQCHNLQGGFRCLCPPGQALLRDGKACAPLEQSGPNVTTVSHRGSFAPWPRPRAPIPSGSYHAWVSLRRGPGPLNSVGRAWCPPGFIRQSGVCTGNCPVGTCHCGRLRALPGPEAPRGLWGPCPEGGICGQVFPGPHMRSAVPQAAMRAWRGWGSGTAPGPPEAGLGWAAQGAEGRSPTWAEESVVGVLPTAPLPG